MTGFYFQRGKADGVNKFVLMFQGGAWCHSLEDCYERSKSHLGSSRRWDTDFYFPDGLASNDEVVNPNYHSWNKVVIGYCDGASFSGTLKHPVKVPEHHDQVFFQGSYILDAVSDTLLKSNFGMNRASDVIISGLSAGGLSVYLHLDNIASKIKKFSTVSANTSLFLFPLVRTMQSLAWY